MTSSQMLLEVQSSSSSAILTHYRSSLRHSWVCRLHASRCSHRQSAPEARLVRRRSSGAWPAHRRRCRPGRNPHPAAPRPRRPPPDPPPSCTCCAQAITPLWFRVLTRMIARTLSTSRRNMLQFSARAYSLQATQSSLIGRIADIILELWPSVSHSLNFANQ